MARPQSGIFAEDSLHHQHLEYVVASDVDRSGVVRGLGRALGAPAAGYLDSSHLVVGFSRRLCKVLFAEALAEGMEDFTAIEGIKGLKAPATQADVWFWIHSGDRAHNVDVAVEIHRSMAGTASLQLDVSGFIRHEDRDFIGFIDGTENPKAEEAKEVALVSAGRQGAAGAFAVTQRWVLDGEAFHSLPLPEQEAAVGRTKVDSVELEGDDMPANSHVSRTALKLDGEPAEIYRRSTPYGTVTEHGLHFVAFARDLRRIKIQLDSMFGLSGDNTYDRLLDFTQPVTGSYWFVPSQTDLERLLE